MPRIAGRRRRARSALAMSLRGTSLGDDTLAATDDAAWREQMLAHTKALRDQQKAWFEGDLFWKRLGVIATVMIPVSAAIWRRFGIGRKKPKP